MSSLLSLINRVISSLLIGAGLTLIVAGLASYTAPAVESGGPDQTPILVGASPSADPTLDLSTPQRTAPAPTATGTSSASPRTSVTPTATTPQPTSTPVPSVASRVVIPALDIDLPVISGSYDPPGNPGKYPLCDVAQFLTQPVELFKQPGQPGTTYLFAHARKGMFLPLLEASQRANGAELVGDLVNVYTQDGHVYLYEIFQVKRHATDFTLAQSVKPGEQRLILQTSEGPKGTVPKLQVAARLLSVTPGRVAEANPAPHPRICG